MKKTRYLNPTQVIRSKKGEIMSDNMNCDSASPFEQSQVSLDEFNYEDDFFVAVFINTDAYKECKQAQLRFLLEAAAFSSLNTGQVDLSTSKRRKIAKRMDITDTSFNNRVSEMVKERLIVKVSSSEYMLNPWIVYRGSKNAANKARRRFNSKLESLD